MPALHDPFPGPDAPPHTHTGAPANRDQTEAQICPWSTSRDSWLTEYVPLFHHCNIVLFTWCTGGHGHRSILKECLKNYTNILYIVLNKYLVKWLMVLLLCESNGLITFVSCVNYCVVIFWHPGQRMSGKVVLTPLTRMGREGNPCEQQSEITHRVGLRDQIMVRKVLCHGFVFIECLL